MRPKPSTSCTVCNHNRRSNHPFLGPAVRADGRVSLRLVLLISPLKKEIFMTTLVCPCCTSPMEVDVPGNDSAVAKIVVCELCEMAFDYDPPHPSIASLV